MAAAPSAMSSTSRSHSGPAGGTWRWRVPRPASGRQLRASNVPVNVLAGSLVKRRLSLRYVRALRRLLAQGRYDVVHAHLYASSAAAAAAVPRHTPLVLTAHTEGPRPLGRDPACVARLSLPCAPA